MIRQGTRAATVAATALVLAVTGGSPPGAATAQAGGPVQVAQETAVAEDVALVAAAGGWGLAATEAHMQIQQVLSGLAEQLAQQYPAQYAGARLAGQPGGTSRIWFKGAVPAGAAELVTGAGIPVAVTGGRPESAAELRERTEAVATHLSTMYKEVAAAVRADGWVEAAVSDGPAPVPDLPPALAARTRVTLAPGPVVERDVIGGTWMQSGPFWVCTSGFTVSQLGTGTTGVTTAAHCPNALAWDNPVAGQPDVPLTFQGQHLGVFGDVQWHTSADPEPDDFYATANSIRDVSAVQSWGGLTFGSWWCVYGRASNSRQCDDVYSWFAVNIVSGTLVSSLVAMRHRNATGGDSGGTWSWGNTAAGIHEGGIWLPFRMRDVFSVAALLPVSLGVVVRT